MRARGVALVVIAGLAAGALAADAPVATDRPVAPVDLRYFRAGDGDIAIRSPGLGERAKVVYRLPDGTYDDAALARVRRVFRSKGDGREGEIDLRLVELLAWLQEQTGVAELSLISGYRSPAYNERLRRNGVQAASASLHTQGMAADVAFPRKGLEPLWLWVRELECCGAGYYAANGFLHVDTGQPRFWEPATSKVGEDLSGGNARLFARTEFDRYRAGEGIQVRLRSLTDPPVRLKTVVRAVADGNGDRTREARIDRPLAGADGCVEVDAETRILVREVPALAPGHLELDVCEPRPGRTPAVVTSNPIAVR
jgi:uncharacterized protein YcbK (DUF882 family)